MDNDKLAKMLADGWIVRDGNVLKITELGQKLMRNGIPGMGTPGPTAPHDSKRHLARLSIKKFKKRKK